MDDKTLIVAYIFVAFVHSHIDEKLVLDEFDEDVLQMLKVIVKINRVEYNNENH